MSTSDVATADAQPSRSSQEIELVGLGWDDPRGYGPLAAVENALARCHGGHAIRVRWDVQPLAGFESRSIDELARQYDLILMDHPHVAAAREAGCLTPLGSLDDDYVGATRASYQYDGRQWAAPVDASCHVAAWRRDIDGHRWTTWDEVLAASRQGLRVAAPLAGVHALMALLSLLVSSGGKATIRFTEQPEMAPALTTLAHLADCFPAALDWNPIEALRAVAEGHVDYLPCTFGYAHFVERGVAFGPLPAVARSEASRSVLGGAGLAVSAYSEQPDAALRFARFAASPEIQRTVWPDRGGQPAHRAAWDDLANRHAFYRAARPAIEAAFVRPVHANWNSFQTTAGSAIERWLRSPEANAKAIITQLQEIADAILK